MDFKDFSQLLINKFSFSPTEDQIAAIGELSKFLISNNDIGLFILKGYAGTGKTTLSADPKRKLITLFFFQRTPFVLSSVLSSLEKATIKIVDQN